MFFIAFISWLCRCLDWVSMLIWFIVCFLSLVSLISPSLFRWSSIACGFSNSFLFVRSLMGRLWPKSATVSRFEDYGLLLTSLRWKGVNRWNYIGFFSFCCLIWWSLSLCKHLVVLRCLGFILFFDLELFQFWIIGFDLVSHFWDLASGDVIVFFRPEKWSFHTQHIVTCLIHTQLIWLCKNIL